MEEFMFDVDLAGLVLTALEQAAESPHGARCRWLSREGDCDCVRAAARRALAAWHERPE